MPIKDESRIYPGDPQQPFTDVPTSRLPPELHDIWNALTGNVPAVTTAEEFEKIRKKAREDAELAIGITSPFSFKGKLEAAKSIAEKFGPAMEWGHKQGEEEEHKPMQFAETPVRVAEAPVEKITSWDQMFPPAKEPEKPITSWDQMFEAPPVITHPAEVALAAGKEAGVVPDAAKGEKSSDEGFWPLIGRAFTQGVVTSSQEAVAGAAATVPSALGGSTIAQQAATLPEPDAQDEVTKLLQQEATDPASWVNARWLGVNLAHAVGGVAPAAALGGAGVLAGGAAAGPLGAIGGGLAGGAFGMAMQQLVPAYKAAKLRGLDEDAAVEEAIIQSGIAAAFGAAMGITGGIPGEVLPGILKRPIAEALFKLGVAQPTLMVAQAQAQKAAGPGGWITPEEGIKGYIVGAGMGAVLHGAHVAIKPFSDTVRERWQGELTPDGLRRGYEVTQEGEPDLPNLTSSSPMWPKGTDFYDSVSKAIGDHPHTDLKPEEWHKVMEDAHGSAKGLELPAWLANEHGEIPKADLLAFVESRGVWVTEDPKVPGTLGLHEPSGKTLAFSTVKYNVTSDRDGQKVLAVTMVSPPIKDRLGTMRADPYDVIAQRIAEVAAGVHADKITWGLHLREIEPAMSNLAAIHGMGRGITRVDGWAQDTPYVNVSPVAASNIRQGEVLFSRGPGTYTNEDPHRKGREAINEFLDRAQASGMPRSAWVKVPEGGNGMYLRVRHEGANRLVDVANLDFDNRSTGAFTHYLDHIERESARRGLNGVRVENIYNERLVPFLERRGYVREADPFDMGGAPSMRLTDIKPRETRASAATGGGRQVFPTASPQLLTPDQLRPAARRIVKIIEALRKAMGMKVPIVVNLHDPEGPNGRMGSMGRGATGYEINLHLGAHEQSGAEGLFETASHEFGHVVMEHFFDRSPIAVKNHIIAAFDNQMAARPANETMNQLGVRRDAAVGQYYGSRWWEPDRPVLSLTPERQRYWAGFEEWFAEQVARWAQTQEKPIGIVDRFFYSMGSRILSVISKFREQVMGAPGSIAPKAREQIAIQPAKEMKEWLDSLVTDAQPFAADIIAAAQMRSQRRNQSAFNNAGEGEITAVPETLSTATGRGLIGRIFGRGGPNPEMAAGADRFNKFYEWMVSLPQLAKRNPHIEGLQRYNEMVRMLHGEKVSMMNEAESTLHLWRGLHTKQADAVAGLINHYMNMKYRSAEEIRTKVTRRPTEAEFQDMARMYGVNDKGMAVFRRVTQDFDRMLERYKMLLEDGAHKIEDPIASAKALEDIAAQIAHMKKAPYYPAMRFGNYTLSVRDGAGKVVHFETFESQGTRDAAHEAARSNFPADHEIRSGYLRKDVAPLLGMPSGLLDKIGEKLELSTSQRSALDELRFEYLPAQSFAHRFAAKRDVPGYSTDFLRAYASYMFHGANYFTRVKYADALRGEIKNVEKSSLALEYSTKRDQIANFMQEHFKMLMDPKPDFANLRSMMFHWALGFSPAAATLNLSQTVLGTYPYLASKFGSDVRAIAAMGRASAKLNTFYSKMRLEGTTDPELKGIAEAVRQGVISETQANVLAATADGRVLMQGFGGNKAEKAFNMFSRASQFFFEMTEQTNRRVAFRAAWDLAMADPGNAHVSSMVRENKILFESLKLRGFTDQEARAFVTAKDAVDSTQYVYAPYARPKFMTAIPGAKTLFLFKSFTQNTLFYLWNNPGAAARSLIILGAAGGLMGLPGMEDMNGIIRALAYHIFGKDFDLQDVVRQFVIDVLHGGGQVDRPGSLAGDQGIRPDILLHGLSRVGYGIPAVMDAMGSIAGMGHIPMPVVDRHQNLSMGNILPIEPGVIGAPQITGPGAGTQNVDSSIARQTQRASGAAFGLGFALYRALETSLQGGFEWKKWEQAMPTALRNASQSFRFYNEGKATNSQGAALVRFDPSEPEHMMEIIGQSLGYRPERLSAAWDRRTAEREAEAFWDVRRAYLLQAAWNAKQSTDPDSYKSSLDAIRKFNQDLPDEARGKAITSDALRESFMSRAKATAATESGIPRQRGNVPLARSVQRLYPEASPDAGRAYPPQGGALGR